MSSVEMWTARDGIFNLERFHENIESLLDPVHGMPAEWTDDLLDFWKTYVVIIYSLQYHYHILYRKVFISTGDQCNELEDDSDDEFNDVAAIRLQAARARIEQQEREQEPEQLPADADHHRRHFSTRGGNQDPQDGHQRPAGPITTIPLARHGQSEHRLLQQAHSTRLEV